MWLIVAIKHKARPSALLKHENMSRVLSKRQGTSMLLQVNLFIEHSRLMIVHAAVRVLLALKAQTMI